MTACELGPEVAEHLGDLANAEHVSILLGAGASAAVGLPSWDELAVQLLHHAGAIDDPVTARAYLARQDPTLAAEAARAASDDWVRVVRDALYGKDGAEVYPGALHLAVANLAATHSGGVSLLTLNLDDLLEEAVRDALDELERDEDVVSRTAAAPRAGPNAHEVQHLHGLLPRAPDREASGMVLTLSDFNDLAAAAHPWQAAALGEAMSKGPLILAGTTFRDANIRQWLHAIRSQVESQDRVVALVAREGLGLSRRQWDDVAEAVRQQWLAVGINSLLVQEHADAAQILRELPAVDNEGYELPQDRAAALWRQQLDDFASLQARHSQLLDADRDTLPSDRGHGGDLTLWLADGSSELVRWTSHDRVYRSPDKLRRVPLGHDSPWTAARAMAESEVLVDTMDAPPQGSRRWRTVVAAPITMDLRGGPNLVVGALSAATTAVLDREQETEWRTALADLVETWADRLDATTE